MWMEHILRTELFEDDVVKIVIWFPRPIFPQAQIENVRRSVNGKPSMCFQVKNAFSNFSGVMSTVSKLAKVISQL